MRMSLILKGPPRVLAHRFDEKARHPSGAELLPQVFMAILPIFIKKVNIFFLRFLDSCHCIRMQQPQKKEDCGSTAVLLGLCLDFTQQLAVLPRAFCR